MTQLSPSSKIASSTEASSRLGAPGGLGFYSESWEQGRNLLHWKRHARFRIQTRRLGHQASHRPRIQSSSLGWVWEFWISRGKLGRPWNLDQNTWDIFWMREWPVKLCSRVTRVWPLSPGVWVAWAQSLCVSFSPSLCLSLLAGRCQLACAAPWQALEVCMWGLASQGTLTALFKFSRQQQEF